MSGARVYLGRLPENDDHLVDHYIRLIRRGIEFCGVDRLLPSRPRLFIKPNLTFPTYRPGVMTSPAAVEAAIIVLKDYADEIWVGDSDSGGYNPFSMHEVYTATGLVDFAHRYGVKVVNLSDLQRAPVTYRVGRRLMKVDLPRLLTDEIDALITMPVPKVHMNTGVSLTFKNQWGCIPEPNDRLRLHPYFAETIVAVNAAVRARFAIIDGRIGLNRSGPMAGDAVALKWLCVSEGIGAGARVACELMQVPLESVTHLRFARRQGLIPELADLELNTELAPFVAQRFYLRRAWTDFPGLLAFKNPRLAHIAYASRWSALLHRILYWFRDPYYEYGHR